MSIIKCYPKVTILGDMPSKSNQYRIITIKGHSSLCKTAAVKKYELPWVNVYNPDPKGGKVLEDYAVEGFPTKVIVNPEGRIVNITTGENPEFFEILDSLVK